MTTTSLPYEYGYDSAQLGFHHDFLMPSLFSLLPQPTQEKKLRVLDLGCGNGSLSHALAQRGYEVVGLEESPSGVAIAQRHFTDCRFIQGSIYSPPPELLDHSFDRVISMEVIEHLFYPKELPRLAKRCLKPNGRLILSTPYHGYLKNLALALTGSLDSHYGVHWDGGHIKFFSVPTLSQLLIAEGYSPLEFRFAGRVPYLWKTMLCSAQLTPVP